MCRKRKAPNKTKAEANVRLVPAVDGAGAFAVFMCRNRHTRTTILMEPEQILGSSSCPLGLLVPLC